MKEEQVEIFCFLFFKKFKDSMVSLLMAFILEEKDRFFHSTEWKERK